MNKINEIIEINKLTENELKLFLTDVKNGIKQGLNRLQCYNFLDDNCEYDVYSRRLDFATDLCKNGYIEDARDIVCEECGEPVNWGFWQDYHNPNIKLHKDVQLGTNCDFCGLCICSGGWNLELVGRSEDDLYYMTDKFIDEIKGELNELY